MKTALIILFSIASISISIISCKKDKSVPAKDIDKIYGEWIWVQSSGGFAGITNHAHTNDSIISFERDGTYKFFVNGILKLKSKFTLSVGPSISSPGNVNLVNIEGVGQGLNSVFFSGQDSLFLNEECYDCFQNIYVKSK